MELTPVQQAFLEKVRSFAQGEVKARAAAVDAAEAFPEDLVGRLRELGLLGIPYPQAVGGAGLDTVCYALAVEEISRACGSTGITLAAHTSLGTNPIYLFGSAEQKAHWLPRLCSGQTLGAFGLTEPGAGSDAGGTRTRAARTPGGWVVNGSKMWITNAAYADVLVFTALTDRDKREISCFLVEKGTPGYSIGACEKKLGLRGSDTHALAFENLHLPEDALLGELGQGFQQMLKTLNGGRISIGAMALGLAQGALDEILEVFKGVTLRQSHAFYVADMATRIQAARHLVYDAARAKDAGRDYVTLSAMAKLFASETASWCADRAIQILGAEGYTRAHAAERIWRDAKLCEIGEGTSEIQRLVISRRLLEAR
ncbi:MAG: acyl-CoA dehydrogenase family protein [Candidatus Delongbacteria bacterium]